MGWFGWRVQGDQDFAEDDFLAGFGELDAEPDAEDDEDDGDDGSIDFEGVLDDEELVLGPAEDGDEDAADEAEDKDVALHGCWVDFTAVTDAEAKAPFLLWLRGQAGSVGVSQKQATNKSRPFGDYNRKAATKRRR